MQFGGTNTTKNDVVSFSVYHIRGYVMLMWHLLVERSPVYLPRDKLLDIWKELHSPWTPLPNQPHVPKVSLAQATPAHLSQATRAEPSVVLSPQESSSLPQWPCSGQLSTCQCLSHEGVSTTDVFPGCGQTNTGYREPRELSLSAATMAGPQLHEPNVLDHSQRVE